MGISTREELISKIESTPSRYSRFVLEEQVHGDEARYFVVGGKVVAAAARRPASVTGDGKHSIASLVDIKNKTRLNHLSLKKLRIDADALALLKDQGYTPDSVLAKNKTAQLRKVSNISQGGDSIDITDDVHDDLKNLAIAALHSIPTLSYAGLDIIAEDHRLPIKQQKAVVLEVNWQPMIRMHHAPAEGKARDVAGEIIDYIFSS